MRTVVFNPMYQWLLTIAFVITAAELPSLQVAGRSRCRQQRSCRRSKSKFSRYVDSSGAAVAPSRGTVAVRSLCRQQRSCRRSKSRYGRGPVAMSTAAELPSLQVAVRSQSCRDVDSSGAAVAPSRNRWLHVAVWSLRAGISGCVAYPSKRACEFVSAEISVPISRVAPC